MSVKLCGLILLTRLAVSESFLTLLELDNEECQELQHEFLKVNDFFLEMSDCNQFLESLKKSYIQKYHEDGISKFVSDLVVVFKKIDRDDLADFLNTAHLSEEIEELEDNSLSKNQDEISLSEMILSKDRNPLQFIRDLIIDKQDEHSIFNDVFKIIFIITLITIIQMFVCCYCFKYFCPVIYRDLKRTAIETLS